jgi:hypothetical protein
MIHNFVKAVASSLILSVMTYTHIASADVIESTFEWSATCYDCNYFNRGTQPSDEGLFTVAGGSITLKDYTIGANISLDNFVSFNYDIKSMHLLPFTIGTGGEGTFSIVSVAGTVFGDATLTLSMAAISNLPVPPPPQAPSFGRHTNDPTTGELLMAIAHARADLAMFNELNNLEYRETPSNDSLVEEWESLTKKVMEADEAYATWINELSPFQSPMIQQELARYLVALDEWTTLYDVPATVEFAAEVNGDWRIDAGLSRGLELETFDFGVGIEVVAGLPGKPKGPTLVPTPPSFAIFALGLIGLASRRFMRQS